MAVLLGNLALLIDGTTPRTVLPDRKSRPVTLDVILNLPKPKRESPYSSNPTIICSSLATKNFESEGELKNSRDGILRGRPNSKPSAIDFDAADSSDDDSSSNGNGFDEEEEEEESFEMRMRRRVKELEEMKELEKKAEELQSRMGEDDSEQETEEQKRMRVRKELEKVAKEQAERRATANLMFELGQKAYGRGMYGRSIEFFEGALTIIQRPTLFGGEIQIWLAMAYEADNRHADCIALYKQLEARHPNFSIRRQAGELRYILQAPKLKISQDERVTIPLIGSSYDRYAGTWSDKYKDGTRSLTAATTNQLPSSRDFLGDFLAWRPPIEWEKNRAFWVALTLWLGLVGVAIVVQR